jgi:hypothetical protein
VTGRLKVPLRRAAGERVEPIAKQWEGEVAFDIEVVSVILSEAKDLMPVASGDWVLRCAQDDMTHLALPALRAGPLPLPPRKARAEMAV